MHHQAGSDCWIDLIGYDPYYKKYLLNDYEEVCILILEGMRFLSFLRSLSFLI